MRTLWAEEASRFCCGSIPVQVALPLANFPFEQDVQTEAEEHAAQSASSVLQLEHVRSWAPVQDWDSKKPAPQTGLQEAQTASLVALQADAW